MARTRVKIARLLFTAIGVAVTSTAHVFAQTAFTPGDIVVSTYGVTGGYLNGTLQPTSIDGVPTPISLEEFTINGTYVMTDTLPTTDSGSNLGIVGEYGSSSEANLQLSQNGQYLLIGGYQADASISGNGSPGGLGYYNANPDGVDALAQSNSTNVPRLVAEIRQNGVVDTSTEYTGIFNQNNPRSVWSATGATLYVSGQGNSTNDNGIFTVQEGSNTVTGGSPAPTPITSNNAISTRIVTEYNGNMYFSVDQKNAQTGIFEYSGIPTSSAATPTQIIPATAGSFNLSPDGFYFANSTTLYVADTGDPKNKGLGDGGIQKWTFNGSSWVLDYTLTPSNFIQNFNDKTNNAADGQVGFESITGEVVNGSVDLFAVSYTLGDADSDGLYAISDNLTALNEPGNETFDELATAPGIGNVTSPTAQGGAVFKSVSFAPVPEPSTYAVIFGIFTLGFVAWRRRFQSSAVAAAKE